MQFAVSLVLSCPHQCSTCLPESALLDLNYLKTCVDLLLLLHDLNVKDFHASSPNVIVNMGMSSGR